MTIPYHNVYAYIRDASGYIHVHIHDTHKLIKYSSCFVAYTHAYNMYTHMYIYIHERYSSINYIHIYIYIYVYVMHIYTCYT